MNDNDTIQQLFKSKSIIITPITGKGRVNRVYIVSQGKDRFVIRINSEEELSRFKKEVWCSEEATKEKISTPRVLDVGARNDAAYMILNFVAGSNGDDITENRNKVWYTMGNYAQKINQISTQGFSENMVSPGVFSDSWRRYLDYNINSLSEEDKLLSLGTINKKQSAQIKDKLLKLRETKFKFGLIHGDISLENVIVAKDNVTIIDWGCAESSIVPHMEIVDLLQNQVSENDDCFSNFLRGYSMKREEYESIKSEIDTLTLLQAIDKLRWAIDRSPDQISNFSEKVIAIASV